MLLPEASQRASTRWWVALVAGILLIQFLRLAGTMIHLHVFSADGWQVIIDNMMNLEVLFRSAALTGNSTLRDIALSHADKTMANHIRKDGKL